MTFNQPGTIQCTSDTDRLQAPNTLTVNADVTVEMLDLSNGDTERRFAMGGSLRGSANVLVIGTPADPTDIPANITRNEFETGGSTASLNAGQRYGPFSGTVTSQDYVDFELRFSYIKGAVVIAPNGTLEYGRHITSGNAGDLTTPETVSLGEVTIQSGATLILGFEEVPSGSTSASDATIQPNRLSLTAAGTRSGSLTLADGSTTVLPIIGQQPGLGFGAITAEGDVSLDGTLQVVINPPQTSGHPLEGTPYAATIGDTFDIITTAVSAPDGDYNRDGTVDQDDYDMWKDTFGSTTNPLADGNDNDVVDAADYTVWRDNLGATGSLDGTISGTFDDLQIVDDSGVLAAAGATLTVNYISSHLVQLEVVAAGAGALSTAVPEPQALLLLVCAAAFGGLQRKRRG